MEGRVVIPRSIIKSLAKVMVEMLNSGRQEPIPGYLETATFSFGGWEHYIVLTNAVDAIAIEMKPKEPVDK